MRENKYYFNVIFRFGKETWDMDELEYPPATMSYFCDLIRKDAERLSNLFEAENREKLRAGFNDAASEVRKHFANALTNYLNQNYRARIEELDNQVAEIRALRRNKSESCKRLEAIQDECRLLIADIHKEYNDTEIASDE